MRLTSKNIEATANKMGYSPVKVVRDGAGVMLVAAHATAYYKTKIGERSLEAWLKEIEALVGPARKVEKTNLMTGKTYMEAVDTPLCCSPASETYWSM